MSQLSLDIYNPYVFSVLISSRHYKCQVSNAYALFGQSNLMCQVQTGEQGD
jgi:hypothetical protein